MSCILLAKNAKVSYYNGGMKYDVLVKPGTSQEKVVEGSDGLTVWVRAKAHDGEANAAVIKVLAKYFRVGKSRVKIVNGTRGRKKVVEVLEEE